MANINLKVMAVKYLAVLFGHKGVGADMLVIRFSAHNQRLRRTSTETIPSGIYGKLKVELDFRTDDWDEVEIKTVNFYYDGQNYPVELDENNQCFVPQEVIYAPSFKISVFGGDIVTNTIAVPVQGKSEHISSSAYEELIKLIDEHTHEEYLEDAEIEEIIPDVFDAGPIIERS